MKKFFGLFCLPLFLAGTGPAVSSDTEETEFQMQRQSMIDEQLKARDISDPKVLDAMRRVPRHRFVPHDLGTSAYADRPLPIGHQQTISQPYIVALMTQLLDVRPGDRVLEIGTGSGYQAAVLSELTDHVYSIEIVEPLAAQARVDLENAGYHRVNLKVGDGYLGWPEHAPFDAIIVTCAPDRIPQPLIDQLDDGGRMIIPVGRGIQELVLLHKEDGQLVRDAILPVRFVPMTGKAQDPQ